MGTRYGTVLRSNGYDSNAVLYYCFARTHKVIVSLYSNYEEFMQINLPVPELGSFGNVVNQT